MNYKNFLVDIENNVAYMRFNNPQKANAMDSVFWDETQILMRELDDNPEVRVVVLSGEGKHFSSGIDLSSLMELQQKLKTIPDEGRQKEYVRRHIKHMQENFNAIEACRKPVIAAVKGACIGGAIDMITACDMRYATEGAYFCVKEVDLGIVADMGTLQRLSHIISEGIARELAFTARTFDAKEAKEMNLVNALYPDEATLMKEVKIIAENIAKKSPLTVRGIKEVMNYSREHTTLDGLDYVATWNSAMMISKDLQEAAMAYIQKREPIFEN